MIYSKEVQEMCQVAKGPNHGPAPIPEESKWVKAKEIADTSLSMMLLKPCMIPSVPYLRLAAWSPSLGPLPRGSIP